MSAPAIFTELSLAMFLLFPLFQDFPCMTSIDAWSHQRMADFDVFLVDSCHGR